MLEAVILTLFFNFGGETYVTEELYLTKQECLVRGKIEEQANDHMRLFYCTEVLVPRVLIQAIYGEQT